MEALSQIPGCSVEKAGIYCVFQPVRASVRRVAPQNRAESANESAIADDHFTKLRLQEDGFKATADGFYFGQFKHATRVEVSNKPPAARATRQRSQRARAR